MFPLLLALVLSSPPTLGDGLRAIGAFDEAPTDGLDRSLDAPPPPPRWTGKVLVLTGGALILTGLIGASVSGGCTAQDGEGRCLDARSTAPVYPILTVVGLATAITGGWWLRHDAPVEGSE